MGLITQINTQIHVLQGYYKKYLRRRILRLLVILNKITLPGFRGAGLVDVMLFFIEGLSDRTFTLSASAMASRFFFSLFPGMIFLFTLIPYLPVPDIDQKMVAFLAELLPPQSLLLVQNTVSEVFNGAEIGLLSVNLFLALFTALQGIVSLMYAFSKEDEVLFKKRNIVHVYVIALFIFVLLIIGFLLSIGIWIGADILVKEMIEGNVLPVMVKIFHVFTLFTLFSLFTICIAMIFFIAPETTERWSFISPGGILASIMSLAAFLAFRWFLSNFANYNKFYGSLSAIMILMVFFYWLSIVLLIGFELNAAIDNARKRGRIHSKRLIT